MTENHNTTVLLPLSWGAYTHPDFEAVYDRHSQQLGRRPAFLVAWGEDSARVHTVSSDADVVRTIIDEMEYQAK